MHIAQSPELSIKHDLIGSLPPDYVARFWTKSNRQRDPPWCRKYGDFSRRRLCPSLSTTTTLCSESTWKMGTSLLRKRYRLTNVERTLKSLAKPQVLADMSKAGVKPDKETFQCLISRHCQVYHTNYVKSVCWRS